MAKASSGYVWLSTLCIPPPSSLGFVHIHWQCFILSIALFLLHHVVGGGEGRWWWSWLQKAPGLCGQVPCVLLLLFLLRLLLLAPNGLVHIDWQLFIIELFLLRHVVGGSKGWWWWQQIAPGMCDQVLCVLLLLFLPCLLPSPPLPLSPLGFVHLDWQLFSEYCSI